MNDFIGKLNIEIDILKKIKEIFKNPEIQNCLKKNNFEQFYDLLFHMAKDESADRLNGNITKLLYNIGIDPLNYMEKVPNCFLYDVKGITQFTIPKNINRIEAFAFTFCTDLNNISLSNNIKIIESFAFAGDKNLKSVNIPNSVKEIWASAFQNTGLVNLVIPEGVTYLGGTVCKDCNNLKNIELPSTLNEVLSFNFYGCKNLETIKYAGTKRRFQKLFYNEARVLNDKVFIICRDGKMKCDKNENEFIDIG